MATNESNKLEQKLASLLHKSAERSEELKPSELSNPEQEIKKISTQVEELVQERQKQRLEMLKFVKNLTFYSFSLLAGVVIFQGLVRLFMPGYQIVNDMVFNILAVSVFGQVIGVVLIIVKSLWDDSKYLDKM